MNLFSSWLVKAYTDENDRSLAVLLGNILLFSILGLGGISVTTVLNADWISTVAIGITVGSLLIVLLFIRLGWLGITRWLVPLIAFSIVSYVVYAVGDGTREVQILGYPIVVLLATLLLGTRGAWAFTLLSSLSYTLILYIHKFELFRPYELASRLLPSDAAIAAIVIALVAVIAVAIVNRLTASLQELQSKEGEIGRMLETLEEAQERLKGLVAERSGQILVASEIGRVANASLDVQEILHTVVEQITDRFGYYYAAVYLVDESGIWANLEDASGEAAEALLSRRYRLQVGGRSMVGTAISTMRPRIAQDAESETIRYANPLLPHTRSEIALPLLVGNRALGAINVQSVERGAFDADEIAVLQSVANQVAVALENARLLRESQQRLEELNRLYRRDVRARSQSIRYMDGEVGSVPLEPLPEAAAALETKEMQVVHADGQTTVTLPFLSGGQVIGLLHLKSKGRRWSQEDLSLLENAANQVSTALENALLVRESQERARQEQALSEGASRIRETLDIEAILQTAAAEIQRSLDLQEVEVRVGLAGSSDPDPER